MSELFGMLANDYTKFDRSTKHLVKRWLNKVAEQLGLGEFIRFKDTAKDEEVMQLLETVAGKVSLGEVVSEGDLEVLNAGITKSENKSRVLKFQKDFKDDVFGYNFSYIKNGDQFQKLVEAGIINKDVDIKDFSGKVILLHQPDGAFSGEISRDGEVLVEGKGGIFYPVSYTHLTLPTNREV